MCTSKLDKLVEKTNQLLNPIFDKLFAFLKPHLAWIYVATLSYIIILLFFIVDHNIVETSNYIELHALFLIIFTGIIILVAYTQLSSISRTVKTDFLMKLDERYGSIEIIQARQIIHRYYRFSKDSNTDRAQETVRRYRILTNNNILSENELIELIHWRQIGKAIDKLSKASDPASQKEYILVLNLLDFLESISYYANNGHIEQKQIDDLMGISLVFFYAIFKLRIKKRREKYGINSFYEQFENLSKKIFEEYQQSRIQ